MGRIVKFSGFAKIDFLFDIYFENWICWEYTAVNVDQNSEYLSSYNNSKHKRYVDVPTKQF